MFTITRKRNEQLHNDFYIIQRYINIMERKDYFEKITWIAICCNYVITVASFKVRCIHA